MQLKSGTHPCLLFGLRLPPACENHTPSPYSEGRVAMGKADQYRQPYLDCTEENSPVLV